MASPGYSAEASLYTSPMHYSTMRRFGAVCGTDAAQVRAPFLPSIFGSLLRLAVARPALSCASVAVDPCIQGADAAWQQQLADCMELPPPQRTQCVIQANREHDAAVKACDPCPDGTRCSINTCCPPSVSGCEGRCCGPGEICCNGRCVAPLQCQECNLDSPSQAISCTSTCS